MSDQKAQSAVLRAYVGAYTQEETPGLFYGVFHLATGQLELLGSLDGIPSPSFLAVDSTGRHLYAVSEVERFGGQPTGGVYAYALDETTGQPTLLNSQPSGGTGPCHLCVGHRSRCVLVANYSGGSLALLPIQADGSLGAPSSIIVHDGTGPDPQRQTRPHAHSVVLDPTERYVFCADLGLDRVFVYHLDAEAGTLTPADPPSVSLPGGCGPRHSVFHPNGRFLYVNTEMASTVTVWASDAADGILQEVQTFSTLPPGFSGSSAASGLQIHPSGRFLYSANRGPDTIAVFSVDSETGRLTAHGSVPSGGKNPRDLTIDPTGAYLAAVHQESGTVVSLAIDRQSGALTPAAQLAGVPGAACIVFAA